LANIALAIGKIEGLPAFLVRFSIHFGNMHEFHYLLLGCVAVFIHRGGLIVHCIAVHVKQRGLWNA